MQLEKELKNTSVKHSAVFTGVEQSVDVSPNFKLMKKDFTWKFESIGKNGQRET